MRILKIRLVNFIGIYKAMGLYEFECAFDKIDKQIIQIYGQNRCGKTVLLQLLHPCSNINFNGDERTDLPLIISGKIGIKNIIIETHEGIYDITYTFKPTATGNHTVSASIIKDNNELNPSGGITMANNIIDKCLGINKYIFQFIINGTQLQSFAQMNSNQRKTLLNKAMGIDIYDKINRLATEDYRYTNKIISSLNNTKEYLLRTYGTYESLLGLLNAKQNEKMDLDNRSLMIKTRLDSLSGIISTITKQNPQQELIEINSSLSAYTKVVDEIGKFDDNLYDQLVNKQMSLNNQINELRNQRNMYNKDIDILYSKRNDIESLINSSIKANQDYQSMLDFVVELKYKIDSIQLSNEHIISSSSYINSMISLGQAINEICKDIATNINEKHLKMFAEMVSKGIDISAFLMKEGSQLMDNEKEKSTITRIRSMINSVNGSYIDNCQYSDCIYRKTHDMLETYFKSFQSVSKNEFTQYDLEQLELGWKNVQTINRLINTEFSDDVKSMFRLDNIMMRTASGEYGVDIKRLHFLLEESAKIEQRNRYIQQLTDAEKTVDNMRKTVMNITTTDSKDSESLIKNLNEQINDIQTSIKELDNQINTLTNDIQNNDHQRMMLSSIKNLNIKELTKRHNKLSNSVMELHNAEQEYSQLYSEYNQLKTQLAFVSSDLETLTNANNQYQNTLADIEKNLLNDNTYKIIAEATSSTKGKPVYAIREKMDEALSIANRLLSVMYSGDDRPIKLLKPEIDETKFTLPFACGIKESPDIRYGSQSELMTLSIALSLSLASLLTKYNVILLDECDGYLDMAKSENFVLMIYDLMSMLKMQQVFIISHHIDLDQFPEFVYQLDLSAEIERQKDIQD